MSGRVLQGADSGHSAGTSISAGLPNITGAFSPYTLAASGSASGSGALTSSSSSAASSAGTGSHNNCGRTNFVFDASNSNSIYGNSNTVQPPALAINFCIKY